MKKYIPLYVLLATLTIMTSCGNNESVNENNPEIGNNPNPVKPANPTESNERMRVAVAEINFRTDSNADSAKVESHEILYWGTEFDVIEKAGDWVHARLEDGTEGWVRATYENKDYLSNVEYEIARIDSAEFLADTNDNAAGWDHSARLTLICGDNVALDGRARNWVAFYTSPNKPGKKLMCKYPNFGKYEDFDMTRTEEWNEDWVWHSGTPRDDIGVAPAPAWLKFIDEYTITSSTFVSSADLCTTPNISETISIIKKEKLTPVINDYDGFYFTINDSKWIIGLSTHSGEYHFYFDAGTGRFNRYEEMKR